MPGAAGAGICPGQKVGKAEGRAGRRWHCVTVMVLQGEAGVPWPCCVHALDMGKLPVAGALSLVAAEPHPALLGQ